MTWICYGAKTKSELKRKLSDTAPDISFEDPSIFAPRFFWAQDMEPGTSLICTNHPKRSWFAKVERRPGGEFRVS